MFKCMLDRNENLHIYELDLKYFRVFFKLFFLIKLELVLVSFFLFLSFLRSNLLGKLLLEKKW